MWKEEARRDSGPDRSVPDEALLEQAVREPDTPAGQAAALELFSRYQRRVYVWCHRVVRDHEKALDLAQESLLLAYRSLASFQGRARFSSWLFAITRNRCRSALRSVRVDGEEAEVDELVSTWRRPDEELEVKEETQAILRLMNEVLEPVEREALWLRAYERVAVDDITRILAIESESGARGVLQTARRKLRAALQRQRKRGREAAS
jgi:RNA polymerase sigma-70 factor (ECF subfamily)